MNQALELKRIIYFRYPGENACVFLEGKGDEQFVYRTFEDKKSIRIQGMKLPYQNKNLKLKDGSHPKCMTKGEYAKAFRQIQAEIKDQRIEKIILSRVIQSTVDTKNLENRFEKLCELYPDAFVYLGAFGEDGIWGGATPERLISYQNKIASTVALAGTKTTTDPEVWTEKEREEHRHVEDFIKSLHNATNSPLVNKSEVYFSQAGHLFHLKSDFEFKIERSDFWKFVDQLHPTPAVCGLPREGSKKLISKIENHQRGLYTGFLGYISSDPSQKIELFVNLRCFQLRPNALYSYVGGGITEASNEEDEWQETIEKSKTIGRVFDN